MRFLAQSSSHPAWASSEIGITNAGFFQMMTWRGRRLCIAHHNSARPSVGKRGRITLTISLAPLFDLKKITLVPLFSTLKEMAISQAGRKDGHPRKERSERYRERIQYGWQEGHLRGQGARSSCSVLLCLQRSRGYLTALSPCLWPWGGGMSRCICASNSACSAVDQET